MSKSTHPRRIAREAVLQALYAYEITKEKRSKVLKDIINRKSYDNDLKKFRFGPKIEIVNNMA